MSSCTEKSQTTKSEGMDEGSSRGSSSRGSSSQHSAKRQKRVRFNLLANKIYHEAPRHPVETLEPSSYSSMTKATSALREDVSRAIKRSIHHVPAGNTDQSTIWVDSKDRLPLHAFTQETRESGLICVEILHMIQDVDLDSLGWKYHTVRITIGFQLDPEGSFSKNTRACLVWIVDGPAGCFNGKVYYAECGISKRNHASNHRRESYVVRAPAPAEVLITLEGQVIQQNLSSEAKMAMKAQVSQRIRTDVKFTYKSRNGVVPQPLAAIFQEERPHSECLDSQSGAQTENVPRASLWPEVELVEQEYNRLIEQQHSKLKKFSNTCGYPDLPCEERGLTRDEIAPFVQGLIQCNTALSHIDLTAIAKVIEAWTGFELEYFMQRNGKDGLRDRWIKFVFNGYTNNNEMPGDHRWKFAILIGFQLSASGMPVLFWQGPGGQDSNRYYILDEAIKSQSFGPGQMHKLHPSSEWDTTKTYADRDETMTMDVCRIVGIDTKDAFLEKVQGMGPSENNLCQNKHTPGKSILSRCLRSIKSTKNLKPRHPLFMEELHALATTIVSKHSTKSCLEDWQLDMRFCDSPPQAFDMLEIHIVIAILEYFSDKGKVENAAQASRIIKYISYVMKELAGERYLNKRMIGGKISIQNPDVDKQSPDASPLKETPWAIDIRFGYQMPVSALPVTSGQEPRYLGWSINLPGNFNPTAGKLFFHLFDRKSEAFSAENSLYHTAVSELQNQISTSDPQFLGKVRLTRALSCSRGKTKRGFATVESSKIPETLCQSQSKYNNVQSVKA